MHHLSQLCLDKSLMQNTAEACWIFKLCPLLSNQPQRREQWRGKREFNSSEQHVDEIIFALSKQSKIKYALKMKQVISLRVGTSEEDEYLSEPQHWCYTFYKKIIFVSFLVVGHCHCSASSPLKIN